MGHLPDDPHEASILKQKARQALQSAIYRGKITKPTTCSRCGAQPKSSRDIHGHHADYTKPLDVEWICQPCHQAEDRSGWARKPMRP